MLPSLSVAFAAIVMLVPLAKFAFALGAVMPALGRLLASLAVGRLLAILPAAWAANSSRSAPATRSRGERRETEVTGWGLVRTNRATWRTGMHGGMQGRERRSGAQCPHRGPVRSQPASHNPAPSHRPRRAS